MLTLSRVTILGSDSQLQVDDDNNELEHPTTYNLQSSHRKLFSFSYKSPRCSLPFDICDIQKQKIHKIQVLESLKRKKRGEE